MRLTTRVVVATTNDREAIDCTLRWPARFDRQLVIGLAG
jgi:hypothetical protein